MSGPNENVLFGAKISADFAIGIKSLAEFCLTRLEKQTNHISLIDGITGDSLTSEAIRIGATRVAESLRALNVTDVDKVAICSENRSETALVMFGTQLMGAILVPMNPTYTARELHHAINLTSPRIVFATAATIDAVLAVAKKSACVERIICMDRRPDAMSSGLKIMDYAEFIRLGCKHFKSSKFLFKRQEMHKKVALILFSSGTTGLPKGVELTEYNILMTIGQHEQIIRIDSDIQRLTPNAVVLTIGPWSHAFGCLTLLGFTLLRPTCVFLTKFDDKIYLSAIQKYKINTLHVVPPLMVFLAKSPTVDNYDLSSVKLIACGAAPLSRELAEAVRHRIGVQVIRQGYGLTEVTLAVAEQTATHSKAGSVGNLRPGVRGRVRDIETGLNLPANQCGELQFAGPTLMKGYIDDVAATNETIDSDGWLHTGDIGYYDEDSEWFIVDRLKELIKTNGFQVPPAELEGILLQHPLISDVGVVGIPDERFGEVPLAFVVLQHGFKLSEQQVKEFVAERTSKAKRLHGGVRFVASIPKNPSGKILRRELRDLLKATQSKL